LKLQYDEALSNVAFIINLRRYTSGFPHLVKSGALSYPMPNPYNISIHFPTIVIMFFLGYVPGFPMLFGYMLSQRKSVLAPKKKGKSA
jgi:very-long-chain (3R)-3-hydroxyacyl-CoA dehydratase